MATLLPTIQEIIATVEAQIEEIKGKIQRAYLPYPSAYTDHLEGELRHLYIRLKRLRELN